MSGIQNKKIINWFQLAMINIAAVVSLRNLPLTAEYGTACIFLFAAASLFFFFPQALVSAELASSFDKSGGVYRWVKEAFGARAGVMAIWFQWVENVVWYPTILTFLASMIAYALFPELASNRWFNLSIILSVFWGMTLLCFLGMKVSAYISTIGSIIGTVIPGVLVIAMGLAWVIQGNPLQIGFSAQSWLPDMSSFSNIVFFAGVMTSLAGLEGSAVHIRNVENPQKNFPKAIFLAAFVVLVLSAFGSLSIASVVPNKELDLVAGIMQAFTAFFNAFGISSWIPWIAAFCAIGALTQISTWIISPCRGLQAAAEEGDLPHFFKKVNKRGMPTHILVLQGGIVTILSLAFLIFPTISSSYWILMALMGQLYFIMYFLMFAAFIRLRYSCPRMPRPFSVSGKKAGVWAVGLMGIAASVFAILIGFVPPSQLNTGSLFSYVAFLAICLFVLTIIPLVIAHPRYLAKK